MEIEKTCKGWSETKIGYAMKTILPLLIASATVSHAQTAPAKATSADRYSASIDKYEIVRDGDDFDGLSLGAKAGVADNLNLAFSWANVSSDAFALNVGDPNVEFEVSRISLGADYNLSAGPGDLILSLAYAKISAESEIGVLGDAFENNQFVLGARYEQKLVGDFSFALSASHFINDFSVKGLFAADVDLTNSLVNRYEDSTTSFGVTLAYRPTRLFTFHLTYATEDALLGLANADNTISFGIRANF
jgi:hypothetical protein